VLYTRNLPHHLNSSIYAHLRNPCANALSNAYQGRSSLASLRRPLSQRKSESKKNCFTTKDTKSTKELKNKALQLDEALQGALKSFRCATGRTLRGIETSPAA